MLRAFLKWIVLFFLIVESLGLIESLLELVLKMSHGSASLWNVDLGSIGLQLALRMTIVGFILWTYLLLRDVSRLPLTITRQSALLTARAAQSACLAVVAFYAFVAERLPRVEEHFWLLSEWSLCALAFGTVICALFVRKRFLVSATEGLRRDAHDAKALAQWRQLTLMSMVLAMSIGIYGFILRMTGSTRTIEWSFFFASAALLFLWRPRLEDPTSSPATPRPSTPG